MKASYRISKTPEHLVRIGTEPFYIQYLYDGYPDFDYERRAKSFYETEAKAIAAGKRYIRKMKKDGFEI